MAAAPTRDKCKRFINVLNSLGSGLCSNSFSRRGKRKAEEVDCFKRAICAEERQEQLQRFCKALFQRINRCIAEPAASVDLRRERSYQMFYQARAVELNKLWNDFHAILGLPQPDVIWTQTVNRLLFNQALVACIDHDARKEQQPEPSMLSICRLCALVQVCIYTCHCKAFLGEEHESLLSFTEALSVSHSCLPVIQVAKE